MNRLFGSASKPPGPTLEGSIANLEDRISRHQVAYQEKTNEIMEAKRQYDNTHNRIAKDRQKKKLFELLKKRRSIERLQNDAQKQLDTITKAQNMQADLKNSIVMVDHMKRTAKELKKQYGKVDLDEIERAQDELADMFDIGNEIQETISRGFSNPEEIDESELDAELDALGEEVEYELEMQRNSAVPGFLEEEVPEFIDEPPEVDKAKVQEAAR